MARQLRNSLRIVAPLGRLVDRARREIAVGQDPKHREMELRSQGLVGPLDRGINQPLCSAAGDGKVVRFEAAHRLRHHHLVGVAIRDVHDGVLDDLGLLPWLEGVRQRCKGLDPLVHLLGDGPEQAGDLRPGLDLQPLAVALIGEMDDLRLQLHYPLVGRIIVGNPLCWPPAFFAGGAAPSGQGTSL